MKYVWYVYCVVTKNMRWVGGLYVLEKNKADQGKKQTDQHNGIYK